LGFQEESNAVREAAIVMDESESLFRDHEDISQLILGIKEGRYFQGRLCVSRLNSDEASVNVIGLKNELLIQTTENQNRALNADFVALEVLPKSQWVKNFKAVMPDLVDDADLHKHVEVEVEDNNLVNAIN